MTFGCCTRAETFASIKKRWAASGVFANVGSRNLIANWRSVNVLVADHTDAMPPVPSSPLSRYFPAITWPCCKLT